MTMWPCSRQTMPFYMALWSGDNRKRYHMTDNTGDCNPTNQQNNILKKYNDTFAVHITVRLVET